ncbi:MAG: acetyl-CoA decarbonylase/synthase complex subunit gamma [Candidatus Omnitrophota bacterium]
MALSGLEIYKLLPKTNCRKCGFPTCLAFALALAKKSTDISKCPYLSDEAKAILESSSQPPIKLVTIGTGDDALAVGNETVLFRHEEKFRNPAGLGLILEDNLSESKLKESVDFINKLQFERVGQKLSASLIAVKNVSGDSDKFSATIKFVIENSKLNLVLMADELKIMHEGIKIAKDRRPLIFPTNEKNILDVAKLAKELSLPLAVSSNNLDLLSEVIKSISELKVEDLILNIKEDKISQNLENLTQIRRLALKRNFRLFGFPVLAVIKKGDLFNDTLSAGALLVKYASIILLEGTTVAQILSLLTLRQNIYSDPQKPLQVEPKIYQIGSPTKRSPLLVTTNFSLTYYTVLSEVEASKISSYILSVDTEGMSVLTAWAAEKFTAEKISQSIKQYDAGNLVEHKIIIIPGYVAVMSADLEEKSGWQVLVGPREASGITGFLKNFN